MLRFLREMIATLRPADVLDLALVTAFFYLLLALLRRTLTRHASRDVFVALLLYAALYLTARVLDLYLI